MTTALKQRIVGAIFILSLGVILIPLILDKPQINEEHEKEMLSHVIPETPALPDVSEVSKIHYVFKDVESTPTPTPTEEPVQPEPVLFPTDLAATADPTAPLPPLSEHPASTSTEPSPAPALAAAPSPEPAPEPTVSAPAPISEHHKKASASLAEAAQAQWTIQLGAFSSEKNAKALVQKLSKGGFNPYLRQITQDSLVRVYVSPGIPREEAVDLASKLDTEYGLKGIVVRYFQQ